MVDAEVVIVLEVVIELVVIAVVAVAILSKNEILRLTSELRLDDVLICELSLSSLPDCASSISEFKSTFCNSNMAFQKDIS